MSHRTLEFGKVAEMFEKLKNDTSMPEVLEEGREGSGRMVQVRATRTFLMQTVYEEFPESKFKLKTLAQGSFTDKLKN